MPAIVKYDTAGDIINKCAGEVGIPQATDPFSSTDPAMLQLVTLLGSVGIELLGKYEWENLISTYNITTASGDSGIYPLPADFDGMIDQSGWAQNYHWPLRGPYSAQVWQQLVNYPAVGIYLGFRIEGDAFMIWPNDPVPVGQNINFKYMSRYWVKDGVTGDGKDNLSQSSDVVNFDWMLPVKLLKVRFLEAKGFDTAAAANQFNETWDSRVGKNLGAAAPLDLARSARFPYLNGYNVPDLGFGAPAPPGGGYQ